MKIKNKLIWRALYVAVFAACGLVGCEQSDRYLINAPADLQDRIDSIADAKEGIETGDTTYIDIATALVGAEDFSNAWWTTFSDYFTIPTNELLHLEFYNYNSGSDNNWENWCLAIVNEADRDSETYSEYFVLRSDAWGWGGTMSNVDESYAFNIDMVSHNYPDTDGDGDIWNDFRATMNGAYVTMDIDHSATGNVYVTAKAVGTNGTEMEMTYQQPVSASEDIIAFLVCEVSYLNMELAYTIPSKVTVVEDVNPVSISVTGTPSFVEIGDEDFWGNGIATVTFADGSSAEVDTADVSFSVIPDMTTLGEKTVAVAYSKTKQGNYGPAVTTSYTLEVTNAVTALEITTMPEMTTYAFFGTESPAFDPAGLVVTATYSDGSTGILENSTLEFDIPLVAGDQDATVSYVGATGTVTTTLPLTIVEGTSQVGAIDFSTTWWTEFSDDYNVASGESKVITMYCYSNEVNNWHSPCTILRKADNAEYGVVRMDSFGWGDGYATATLTSDWNWDIFTSNINGSKVVITVTNNGDNTADINYDVTYATGEVHFQKYEGITVDSSDLNCALVIEGAYIVITE